MDHRRIKGIVSACVGNPRDITSWKVKVQDSTLPKITKEIIVASTHEDIALAIGLPVDFLIVHLKTSSTDLCESALDVKLIDLSLISILDENERKDEEDEDELVKKNTESILWSIVKEISPDFMDQLAKESLPGSGGLKHKYIQSVIKKAAEMEGFKASLEYFLPNGGFVDVSLAKGGMTIACEVVISNIGGELSNIQKCLDACPSYVHIVSVYENRKTLERVKNKVRPMLQSIDFDRVHFLLVDELISFLKKMSAAVPPSTVTMKKGYKVIVEYGPHPTTKRELEQKRVKTA